MNTPSSITKTLLLCLFAGVLTTTLQSWVGDVTIYRGNYEGRPLEMHQGILTNKPPAGGSWSAVGANGVNIRVFTVYLAEFLHRLSAQSVYRCYRLIDSLSLFFVFIGLFLYLRYWVNELYCVIGTLYVSVVLILTYHFGFFHPWDRLGLLVWIWLLALLRAKRLPAFAALLAVAMTLKPDVMLLPGLYGLYTVDRQRWAREVSITLALFALTFGIHLALQWWLPGGFDVASPSIVARIAHVLKRNLDALWALKLAYPPLLAFLLPCIFATVGLLSRERFVICSVAFAVAMSIPYILLMNFQEVCAEMPLLLLLLPAALTGLRPFVEAPAQGLGIPQQRSGAT